MLSSKCGLDSHHLTIHDRHQTLVGPGGRVRVFPPRPYTAASSEAHRELKKILGAMLDLSLFGAIPERGTATMPFSGLGPRETWMNHTCYVMIGTSLSTTRHFEGVLAHTSPHLP